MSAPPRMKIALGLLLGVVAISFAALFFRLASGTHPLVAAGTRLMIASAILAWPTYRAYRAGRLPQRTIRAGLVAGLFYALHFGTWVSSLTLTSVASSVTLVTATPLLLSLHGLRTGRDRPSKRHLISVLLAVLGVLLLGAHDLSLSREALIGDGLAFAGAAAMAGYLLKARAQGSDLDPFAFTGIAAFVGGLILLALVPALGVSFSIPRGDFLWIALAALIPQLLGHTSLTWSLRHATPTQVGLATVAEPVFSSLLAWWILREALTPVSAIGCAIVLLAVALSLGGAKKAGSDQE